MREGRVHVFGYGSLMYEPELPDRVIEARPARLHGYRRAFNKRSRPRGCPVGLEARPPLAGWVDGGHVLSLVLGTEPGAHMDGLVLAYEASVEEVLLERLHRREGYAPGRPDEENGYLPARVEVEVEGRRLQAWTYLTNPRCRLYASLELEEQAEVLHRATPRCDVDGRARGAAYLFGVERALEERGLEDRYIRDLCRAVRSL